MNFIDWIPFGVLGASLLGSGHCASMCGGLILSVARGPTATFVYHLGRLLGYCTLGGLAGFLGEIILQNQQESLIAWASSLILALTFIYLGIQVWSGKSIHLFILPKAIWNKILKLGPGILGLFSAFLPCGWLHLFLLGAIHTRSSTLGGLYLFFFWLGTLPMLTLTPLLLQKVLRPFASRAPRLAGVLLILVGVGSFGVRILPMLSPAAHSCHQKKEHSHLEKEVSNQPRAEVPGAERQG